MDVRSGQGQASLAPDKKLATVQALNWFRHTAPVK